MSDSCLTDVRQQKPTLITIGLWGSPGHRRVAAFLVAVALATACVSPEVDDDTVPTFSTDTVMGVIQESGTLRVGIDHYFEPPWATPTCPAEPVTSDEACLAPEPEGFLIDFAREVAASLGVEAEFQSASTAQLLSSMEPEAAEYDLAFLADAVSEELVREHTFGNPYYVAHQRLLVPADRGIDSVDTLDVEAVCAYIDDDTGLRLETLRPTLTITYMLRPRCDSAIMKRGAELATSADLFLIQWKAALEECPAADCPGSVEIVGDQLTTEGFAPMVEEAATGMADWVSAVLGEAKNEGRYMQWYERWIAPYLDDPITEPPTMTIEEAAALFPINID